MKIAAIGDTHVKTTSKGSYTDLLSYISANAKALLICGDITDQGTMEETQVFVEEFRTLHMPVICVLGNHDYHNNLQDEIKATLREAEIIVLDKEPYEINGIGFAGVKGFLGGFNEHQLGSFGEKLIREIVQHTDQEAYDLENQLKELTTPKKIVLMHYSPIAETLIGEAADIYPFLGATRFAHVIDQFGGTVAFHGHAHSGSFEGKTGKGVPVYNVSLPVLKKKFPKNACYILEV